MAICEFTIAGALSKMPGEASAAGSFAPRVYIPLQYLPETNLLKPGSVAHYRDYVKFPEQTDVEKRIEVLAPQIQQLGLDYDTVAKRKRDLGIGAGESLPLSESGWICFAFARRGWCGECDPGSSATEDEDGRNSCAALGCQRVGLLLFTFFKRLPWD